MPIEMRLFLKQHGRQNGPQDASESTISGRALCKVFLILPSWEVISNEVRM
jgi:hypothetical protein